MREEIRDILPFVEKPYRYIGGEVGERKKDWSKAKVRLCLAFPDTYEIGMSNVGLAILYNIVNDHEDFLAERVFTPWPDMEEKLSQGNLSLFSLESQKPVEEFDVLGISLPYELSYTNILTIFSLSHIPWRSKDRTEGHPLVIGGGPCAFNPEPVADFFDAIVIGDGEYRIAQIMEAVKGGKKNKLTRSNVINNLTQIEGVYVPSLGTAQKIKKSTVKNLEEASYPIKPVVPYAAVHDRAGVEVSRGCTRGCRFCQAGFIYRPLRYRSVPKALDVAVNQLQSSGHENFSFLSLSLGDYPNLDELLSQVHESWDGPPINAQLPSLRAESLSNNTLEYLGRGRSGSFTFAPEAATERMRRIINKGNTDEDLYVSIEKVFAAGWHKVKLYFMIGLPGETKEEIEGIVEMANRCLDIGKRHHPRAEITVSTSTFVPKAHTPFQWAGQISISETLEKQTYLKKHLRRKNLYYRWHDAHMSFLEGVLSRGDRSLSNVIEAVYQKGGRFDAWDDKFNFTIWEEAFAKCNINPNDYLQARCREDTLSWSHLYTELNKNFLWKEYERSRDGVVTLDCSRDKCHGCGVCNSSLVARDSSFVSQSEKFQVPHEQLATNDERPFDSAQGRQTTNDPSTLLRAGERRIYRIKYTKLDSAAFLGHLELMSVLRSGFRRAKLPLRYSEGYHPRARFSFGKALAVGTQSECEYCDVELVSELDAAVIKEQLSDVFPRGIKVFSVEQLLSNNLSIEKSQTATVYEILGFAKNGLSQEQLLRAIERYQTAKSSPFVRKRGAKVQEIDLKAYVAVLAVLNQDVIKLTLNELEPMLRITEVLERIFNINNDDCRKLQIKKVGVELSTSTLKHFYTQTL